MQEEQAKRVTVDKASLSTDSILASMEIDKEYPWDDWWKDYVECNDSEPLFLYPDDRWAMKKLINKEFGARKLSNRIFIYKHGKSVYMLDGDTAVSSKFFLDRCKKIANATHTTLGLGLELADAKGLQNGDVRMLMNATTHIDGNFTALAGAIGRMKSLPKTVKKNALAHFGVET